MDSLNESHEFIIYKFESETKNQNKKYLSIEDNKLLAEITEQYLNATTPSQFLEVCTNLEHFCTKSLDENGETTLYQVTSPYIIQIAGVIISFLSSFGDQENIQISAFESLVCLSYGINDDFCELF